MLRIMADEQRKQRIMMIVRPRDGMVSVQAEADRRGRHSVRPEPLRKTMIARLRQLLLVNEGIRHYMCARSTVTQAPTFRSDLEAHVEPRTLRRRKRNLDAQRKPIRSQIIVGQKKAQAKVGVHPNIDV
jgi:hypothetical protein